MTKEFPVFLSNTVLIKIINTPLKKQYVLFLLLLLGLLLFVFGKHYFLYKEQRAVNENIQQYTQQLHHQKKIIHALKEKAAAKLLTPEIGRILLPINKTINTFVSERFELHSSKWERHDIPILSLNIRGYFKNLKQFLTALLEKFPALQLGSLEINKIENEDEDFSIEIHVLLLLDIKKG